MASPAADWFTLEECTVEVVIQRRTHTALCASGDFDAMLLEEAVGAPSHSAAYDDMGTLLADEIGDIAWLVLVEEWIGYGLNPGNLVFLQVHQNIKRAASEVAADGTVRTLIGVA